MAKPAIQTIVQIAPITKPIMLVTKPAVDLCVSAAFLAVTAPMIPRIRPIKPSVLSETSEIRIAMIPNTIDTVWKGFESMYIGWEY